MEFLTKEQNPRTKCWKVVVQLRFKNMMEKDNVYPAGWKHRPFFGSRNTRDKKPRVDQGNNVEQQVLMEQEQQDLREKEQSDRQEKLVRLESRMTNPTLDTKISA